MSFCLQSLFVLVIFLTFLFFLPLLLKDFLQLSKDHKTKQKTVTITTTLMIMLILKYPLVSQTNNHLFGLMCVPSDKVLILHLLDLNLQTNPRSLLYLTFTHHFLCFLKTSSSHTYYLYSLFSPPMQKINHHFAWVPSFFFFF